MDSLILTHSLNRARAIHELQLQQGFAVNDENGVLGFAFPAEFLTQDQWEKCKAYHPQLLISAARAQVLGIPSSAGAAALKIDHLSAEDLAPLVAGNKETAAKLIQPSVTPDIAGPLVQLAKQAGILPALIWLPKSTLFSDNFSLDRTALFSKPPVEIISGETVQLPIEGEENSTVTSFRLRHDAGVHLALVIGKPGNMPLVRVHSSCVTGDMLGSLRCDCGGQLQKAIHTMKEQGGILLYLHQEGRGIGITSKLRAYALQEQGMDTFVANQQLGFEEDERDFSIAAAILNAMEYTKIRLLTNNPDKLSAFSEAGINVVERLPLHTETSPHNEAYLAAKKIKRGHF